MNSGILCRAFASLALSVIAISSVSAENSTRQRVNEKKAASYEADNTGRNVRDRDGNRKTADAQDSVESNTIALAEIRKTIVDNNEISLNARNVKVVVDDSTVTLRGPVKSQSEAEVVVAAAAQHSGNRKLVNELEIAR